MKFRFLTSYRSRAVLFPHHPARCPPRVPILLPSTRFPEHSPWPNTFPRQWCSSLSIFSKNGADYEACDGSRLKLHSLYLFCAIRCRLSHFSCLKRCVTTKRSQVTGKFNLLSSIIQVSFLNCVQFDLPAFLQIISKKKKSNESRQFKPNPVYHYLYAKPFL